MRMRWVFLTLVLALMACRAPAGSGSGAVPGAPAAGGAGGAPAAAGADRAPAGGAAAPATAATGATGARPTAGGDLLTPAPPGAVERVAVPAGQPIGRPGLAFMAVDTGQVEVWAVSGADTSQFHLDPSPDNRWVVAAGPGYGYLVDRRRGQAYQWDGTRVQSMAAAADTVVLQSEGQIWLFHPDSGLMRAVLTLPDPQVPAQVAVGPGGRSAVVVAGGRIFHVDAESGSAREMGALPDPAPGLARGWVDLVTSPHGLWVVAHDQGPPVHQMGAATAHAVYLTWQGEGRGAVALSGGSPHLFPAGGRVASFGYAGPGAPAVTVLGPDGQAAMRVLGAEPCGASPAGCWLAGGGGLVVRVRDGWHVLGLDGTLTPLPVSPDAGALGGLVPAPDRPDRLALGCTEVVDRTGRRLAAAVLQREGGPWLVATCPAPWGWASDEMRFALLPSGKGYIYQPPPLLDPLVQQAPLPAAVALAVRAPAGGCLNLRASFSQEAPVLRCLPPGTILVPATPPGRLNKGVIQPEPNPETTDWGSTYWLHVRTPTGERGWVAYGPDSLAFASPPTGDPLTSDPVAALAADAVANLRQWLLVGAGARPCGPECGEAARTAAIEAVVAACQEPEDGPAPGTQEGAGAAAAQVADPGARSPAAQAVPHGAGLPAARALRQAPGFDPARHGAAVQAVEAACQVVREAAGRLGDPQDTPTWRQALQEAAAGLPSGTAAR